MHANKIKRDKNNDNYNTNIWHLDLKVLVVLKRLVKDNINLSVVDINLTPPTLLLKHKDDLFLCRSQSWRLYVISGRTYNKIYTPKWRGWCLSHIILFILDIVMPVIYILQTMQKRGEGLYSISKNQLRTVMKLSVGARPRSDYGL